MSLENDWVDEGQKRHQLLQVILDRRAGQEDTEVGRNLDDMIVLLCVSVL